ncbi:hypothetical protein ACFX2I_008509 [Malus domestica]
MRLLLVKADDSTRHTIVVLLRNVATNVSEIEPPAHVPQPHQRLVLRRRCFLKLSLPKWKLVFGPDIAVFRSSAGLYEYEHDGSKARELEGAIGIKVIRHRTTLELKTRELESIGSEILTPAGLFEQKIRRFSILVSTYAFVW